MRLIYHGFVVLHVYSDTGLFCDDVSDFIKVREEDPSIVGVVVIAVLLSAVALYLLRFTFVFKSQSVLSRK